jgi:hypothetical protein
MIINLPLAEIGAAGDGSGLSFDSNCAHQLANPGPGDIDPPRSPALIGALLDYLITGQADFHRFPGRLVG